MQSMQITPDNISDVYEWVRASGYHIEFDDDVLTIDSETDCMTASLYDYVVKTRGKIEVLTEEEHYNKYE